MHAMTGVTEHLTWLVSGLVDHAVSFLTASSTVLLTENLRYGKSERLTIQMSIQMSVSLLCQFVCIFQMSCCLHLPVMSNVCITTHVTHPVSMCLYVTLCITPFCNVQHLHHHAACPSPPTPPAQPPHPKVHHLSIM